ncbi:3'(2'),5'-bisphosphate nucleotidase CysQ [Qipengyuania spongiae]|uniref:3'(2'),5'-bisphosphate nucleotidase CysQ n=1 Tax=Qipengyuania spongiae TaxID=2909673 RepID=A0ABY5T1N0_9SPHN|nr:3'(2'),5'-bisphosphate nucleotidase CysQ [Qipengyuania spongiae]UVI40707.1 3'(2'),5'-bisphosphate nucleotidase CysQ [Qipengyuania spongiae]
MDLSDAELAAALADHAGRILLAIRASGMFEGRALGEAGDKIANQFLTRALRHHRPEDGLLSEESADTRDRLEKRRVWIVDPVDGSREYGERRADWAVHVGLAIDGAPAVGAVALPDLGLVMRSDCPAEVSKSPGRLRMVVSRTRPPAETNTVARRLDARLLPMGSAGAKAMAVVRGEADIYLHSGGQHEWDNCAPAAVATAHGLHVSGIDGAPLVYNRPDTSVPDLLICRKDCASAVFEALSGSHAG